MFKEVAVENFTMIPKAVAAGANRIELNDNLAVGGTTVSHGVMAEAAKYLNEKNIPLVVMIRPRGGDFVYNDTEIKMMESDLFLAQELGVDAVTFGALTRNNELDKEAMQQETIDWLVDHQVSRILTHGGPLSVPIEDHLAQLQQTIVLANNRIDILPGGGITNINAEHIATELGVNQLHGTKIAGILK